MKSLLMPAVTFCLLLAGFKTPAQTGLQQQDIVSTIRQKDSLFWKAYNTCDVAAMQQFFTSDMEFYHDKGGDMKGLATFAENTKNGLCGNTDFRLRREEVAGSVEIFPMAKNGVVYGAIISGSHVFYINQKDKAEYLDGLAKFTHLWVLQEGVWKMSRVLSFDHGPATYQNKRKAVAISQADLNLLSGTYKGPQTGTITVSREKDHLRLSFANNEMALYPETSQLFFARERDLTFEFGRDSRNKVKSLTVREKGTIVEQATKL